MPKKKKPEEIVQKAVVKYLTQLQLDQKIVFFYSTINEDTRSNGNAPHMGRKRGISDLTVFLEDKVIWLELKKDRPVLKSGRKSTINWQSVDQEYFERKIEKVENNYYHCTYGIEESINLINSYI